jgi:hypothetical protein
MPGSVSSCAADKVAAITAKRCEIRSSEDYEGPEDDEEEDHAPASAVQRFLQGPAARES